MAKKNESYVLQKKVPHKYFFILKNYKLVFNEYLAAS